MVWGRNVVLDFQSGIKRQSIEPYPKSTVDENKKELFSLIADNLIDLYKTQQKP